MKTVILAVLAVTVSGAGAFAVFSPAGPKGMVFVPAGQATLGYVSFTGLYGPMSYDVSAFWMDKTEVTNADYQAFVAKTGHEPAAFAGDPAFNQPDQPVTGVTHDDAMAYCKWAGKRLPMEIEWEKAARGTDGRIYPWGDNNNPGRAHISGEAPVSIAAYTGDISPYGLRGMAGNVSEWVADTRTARAGACRDRTNSPRVATPEMLELLQELTAANGGVAPELCSSPAAIDDSIPGEPCAYIKGNNWNGRPHMTVASNRMWDYTNSIAEFVGFRCATDG